MPNVDGIGILGGWLDKSGASLPSCEHRAPKAEKAFWVRKGILLNKAVPLNTRIQSYSEQIVPRLLHDEAAGHGVRHCASLCLFPKVIVQRIIGIGWRPDGNRVAWFRRANRAAKKLFLNLGLVPVMTKVLKEIHHMASRLQPPCSSAFTSASSTVIFLADVIGWKNTW